MTTPTITNATTASAVYTALVLALREEIATINLSRENFVADFQKDAGMAIQNADRQFYMVGLEESVYAVLNDLMANDSGPAGCPANPTRTVNEAVRRATFRVVQNASVMTVGDVRPRTQIKAYTIETTADFLKWNGCLNIAANQIAKLSEEEVAS